MRLTEARQGVRMLKFMDVFGRWEAAGLTQPILRHHTSIDAMNRTGLCDYSSMQSTRARSGRSR